MAKLKLVREFPNQSLKASAGKLFCSTCREASLKRSIISNHATSTKHKQGKLKLAKKDSRESDIADNEHNFEHNWRIFMSSAA